MTEYRISEPAAAETASYGVTAYINSIPAVTVPDVFPSKEDACRVVALLNELEVELCHLEDIIEDYLTDFSV